jgi:hypothetical protein
MQYLLNCWILDAIFILYLDYPIIVTDVTYKYIFIGSSPVQISERFDILLVCKLQVSKTRVLCPKSKGHL